ncbi:MAG: hypothetical protein H7Y31_04865, partial [Chitinophagaceae bacterium]|nr:hypothetical protein [Chitinophagaceae bacterium]
MKTLEELKRQWEKNCLTTGDTNVYDNMSLNRILRSRVKKHTTTSFQYFWASFALQLMVYALLAHVSLKYHTNLTVVFLGICGVLLYIPFTIVLMGKFKRMASTKVNAEDPAVMNLQEYVRQYQSLLRAFYAFKMKYELFSIPLSSAIGVILTFNLYVPGGIIENLTGAVITFGVTLLS